MTPSPPAAPGVASAVDLAEAPATLAAVTDAPSYLVRRRAVGLFALLIACALAVGLSLVVGANLQSPSATWHGLWAHDDSEASLVVWTLRMPRTVMAIFAGAAFGVAGALIQAITRNPLADPGILGINAGAGFAITLGAGLGGVAGGVGQLWLAFIGALVATILVYAIGGGGRANASPVTLVLAGVALASLLGGVSSAIQLFNPQVFENTRRWGLGNVAVTDLDGVREMLPYGVLGLLLALGISSSLNAIGLGDDIASSLGADVTRTRVLGILAVTLLAGGATALTGGLGFVGLMVPHVVRWFTGPDQRWIVAYSTLAGAVLVLLADVIGRVLVIPSELEAGLVTSFVGAPVLILLVRSRKASAL